MALKLKNLRLIGSRDALDALPDGKMMINTINAHSYNVAQRDELFAEALQADILIPDGQSIVWACKWLRAKSQPKERIAGWDLFTIEMAKRKAGDTVMFMGSSERVLRLIRNRASLDYPDLNIVTYSPPYKAEFTSEENDAILSAINEAHPQLLWIGMTAPKQEKWVYENWLNLQVECHVGAIGAVFDFYAGTAKRAPEAWQRNGTEWLYRLIKEPRRMWRRYLLGNMKFLYYIVKEQLS